jgi:hypothetical protein
LIHSDEAIGDVTATFLSGLLSEIAVELVDAA